MTSKNVTSLNATSAEPVLCSVVCVTYNHADFSRAAIKSIDEQDYENIEIVVVDDGSTDGNEEVVRAALEECGRPHSLISQENTGNVALNFNRGIAASRGDVIFPMSLDDLILPGCVSSKMRLMSQDNSIVMVGNSANSRIDSNGFVTKTEAPNPIYGREAAGAEELLEVEFNTYGSYFVQGTAYHRDLLNAVGGFDEDLEGDDLNFRTKIWVYLIKNPELRFAFLRQADFAYRKHDDNLHKNTMRQFRTVLGWRDRYFQERALPDEFESKVIKYLKKCIKERDHRGLQEALELDPQIAEIFSAIKNTWWFRRRAIKSFIRNLIPNSLAQRRGQ